MPNSGSFLSSESLTLIGALTAAVLALWKQLTVERAHKDRLIAQTTHQADTMEQLARSLDRLRTEGCKRGSDSSSPPPTSE